MKKKLRVVLLIVALVGAVVLIARWRQGPRESSGLTLYGNVDVREVSLAFRQAGRLSRMHFEEGAVVEPGVLLAEIDPQPYTDALAAATAEVQQAKAQLDKLRSGNRAEEIAVAAAAVVRAEAAARNAETEYQRQKTLIETGVASRSAFDAATTLRDESAAQLASAREGLALQRAGSRAEDVAVGEARVTAAEARESQARTALDDCRLLAPSAGVVSLRLQEPGGMVGVQTPVYVLTLRDKIYVRAYAAEPQLGKVAPGTEVLLRTDSSDRVYHGSIGFVSDKAEFTPKSVETASLRTDLVYRLRIVVRDADAALRQGMPVTVDVADGHPRS